MGGELQILVNNIDPPYTASYPLDGTRLFEGKPVARGYRVEPLADVEGYLEVDPGVLEKEKPDYGDLLGCFLGAGVMGYLNRREFEKKRRMLENLKAGVVYIPDTNVLYHRFLSNHGRIPMDEIALVETVYNEIDASLKSVYTPREVRLMKGEAKFHGYLVDGLLERRMKNSRKAAYLALQEYRGLSDEVIKVPAVGETGPDKEENALVFLKSIVEYGRDWGSYPVVLTTDHIMAEACEEADLDHFLFRVPRRLSGRDVTAGRFLGLIRLVSCVYGFMRLNGALIIGEYGGKRERDELKAFLGGQRAERFRRDLVTSRRLMSRIKEKK